MNEDYYANGIHLEESDGEDPYDNPYYPEPEEELE